MPPYREETLTIGSKPSVFQTAPPQPASNARRTWYSELVGGAEASQNGFGALTPQNSTARSIMKKSSGWVGTPTDRSGVRVGARRDAFESIGSTLHECGI